MPGEKGNLLEMIDYQPGSVVSRVLLDLPAGTVTLFAFDEGERLSEHTSPYDAVLQVLEGTALVKLEGKEIDVNGSELVTLPAGKPHSVAAKKRFKMLLTMVRK